VEWEKFPLKFWWKLQQNGPPKGGPFELVEKGIRLFRQFFAARCNARAVRRRRTSRTFAV